MFRDEKLELKVGIFIGVGIFLMFLIVFSISDFYLFEKGYHLEVIFDYVNGIGRNAPVRLAGVHVGEVKNIELFHDGPAGRTQVKLLLWIKEGVSVEIDSIARINTLGLLGEQYIEITPGMADALFQDGDKIKGRNPVNVGQQVEEMTKFAQAAEVVMKRLERGEGTLGKLLMDDALYDDLAVIFGRLKNGEGTIGKLLVKDKIYDDLEEFVDDIKAHPWKLLHKTSGKRGKTDDRSPGSGSNISPRR